LRKESAMFCLLMKTLLYKFGLSVRNQDEIALGCAEIGMNMGHPGK